METQANVLEMKGFMDRYFNTKELSEYLRVPEQTIRRWVRDNEIAFVRIHNLIRFRLSEIENWIDEKKAKASALPESENELFGKIENMNQTEAGDNSENAEIAGDTI
jgi:excisionase family DNA binding protein